MIIFPIINFVLPLMLTCLVLVDNPPRCSECRKKIGVPLIENKIDKLYEITTTQRELNLNPLLDNRFKK